jgi:hypothetical protein
MSDIVIRNIEFMTPVRVSYVWDDVPAACDAWVDFRARRIEVPPGTPPGVAEAFFPFLDESLRLAANAFEATDEEYKRAEAARGRFEDVQRTHVEGAQIG